MRYISAIATLLLGLILVGLGIARLGASGDEEATVETQGTEDAPFTVVTDELIDADAGREEFTIEAEGEYTLAVARTYDIEAWIGDAAHNRISGISEGDSEDDPAYIAAEYVEGEGEAPNPAESDLWVATEATEGDLLYRWTVPDSSGDWALLIFRDGEEPAPATIVVDNPQTTSPALGAGLIIGGGLVVLLSLALFYWAAGTRGSRARKKAVPARAPAVSAAGAASATTVAGAASYDDSDAASEETEQDTLTENSEKDLPPSDTDTEPSDDEETEVTSDPREDDAGEESAESRKPRSGGGLWPYGSGAGSGGAAVTAGLAAAAVLASGIGLAEPAHADEDTTQEEPEQTEEAEPDPEGDVEIEEEMPAEGYSVLLNSQLERILTDIAEVTAAADEEQDAEMLEDRMSGTALQARELAYRNHDLADTQMPAPIGTEVLSAAVTSEQDFPRQAVVITDHPDAEVPQILILEQESPRENYRVVHSSMMAPGTDFPSISAEQGGVTPMEPDTEINGFTPAESVSGTAEYFADTDADFGSELADSIYIDTLHEYYADLTEAADDTEVNFPSPSISEDVTAVQLPDGSTVVAGAFQRVLQMAPLADGDTIFLEHDLVVELVGTDWTTFPAEITSMESVVLRIPPEDSGDEVVLLGVDDIISDASIDTPEWFDGYDGD